MSALAFIKETIDARNILALVVASQHKNTFRVLYFICQQQTYCFDALLPSVDVVAQEEVVDVADVASVRLRGHVPAPEARRRREVRECARFPRASYPPSRTASGIMDCGGTCSFTAS